MPQALIGRSAVLVLANDGRRASRATRGAVAPFQYILRPRAKLSLRRLLYGNRDGVKAIASCVFSPP